MPADNSLIVRINRQQMAGNVLYWQGDAGLRYISIIALKMLNGAFRTALDCADFGPKVPLLLFL